jgi:hypothetical protein
MPTTPDWFTNVHGNRKIAPVPRVLRQKLFALSIRSLPGTWLRDKELVRSHHLSGQKDSGYKANSIAIRNHTFGAMEVNPRLPSCSVVKNEASAGRDETPPWVRWLAAWERCGGKSEMRKSDSGRGRSDRRESGTSDTPRRAFPFHVRSKCAASPCCRTFRNARTRHNRWEPPRRKSASRRLGSARALAVPLPPGSP